MVDEPLAVAVRWGVFVALLATVGAAAFRMLVLGRVSEAVVEAHERRVAAWGLAGAGALVPLAMARLTLQVAELRDPAEPWTTPAGMMLFETNWGIGWWIQVAAALLCMAGFLVVLGRGGRRAAWAAVAVGAVALAATPALSGHAVGSPRLVALAVAADALHVLGAGAWLGSLAIALVTVLARRPKTDPAAVAAIIRAFSPVALGAAALVVASGVLGSWLHLDAITSLWTTGYGRLLLAKVALFALVVILGAFNWRRVLPRLDSDAGVTSLRASARAELAAATLVLLVTAVLVATPLPGE